MPLACLVVNPFIGTFVRLGPNHISIADPDALEVHSLTFHESSTSFAQ
jgi:hypothetical protein